MKLASRRSANGQSSTHSSSHHFKPASSTASIANRVDALVTLFKRDGDKSPPDSAARPDDTVTMCNAGQRVIPGTLNLEPIPEAPVATGASSDGTVKKPQPFIQAGGHGGSFRAEGAVLVKKVTEGEVAFYEGAQRGDWPRQLLPSYHGRAHEGAIRIENLTYGFRRPCLFDLKMGVQTVENDEASLIKRLRMTALDHVTG